LKTFDLALNAVDAKLAFILKSCVEKDIIGHFIKNSLVNKSGL
jgi:hypothetical protein